MPMRRHHTPIRSTLSSIGDPFDHLVVEGITLPYPYDPIKSENRFGAVVDENQQIEWDDADEVSLQPNGLNKRRKMHIR